MPGFSAAQHIRSRSNLSANTERVTPINLHVHRQKKTPHKETVLKFLSFDNVIER